MCTPDEFLIFAAAGEKLVSLKKSSLLKMLTEEQLSNTAIDDICIFRSKVDRQNSLNDCAPNSKDPKFATNVEEFSSSACSSAVTVAI